MGAPGASASLGVRTTGSGRISTRTSEAASTAAASSSATTAADGLAEVADHRARERRLVAEVEPDPYGKVRAGEDAAHAGRRGSLRGVHRRDRAVGVRAGHERGVQQAGDAQVGRKARAAVHLVGSVGPRHGTAHGSALGPVRRHRFTLRVGLRLHEHPSRVSPRYRLRHGPSNRCRAGSGVAARRARSALLSPSRMRARTSSTVPRNTPGVSILMLVSAAA